MKLKSHSILVLITGTIIASSELLPPPVNAESVSKNSSVNNSNSSFLEQINEQYSKLVQSIQEPIQNLTRDFSNGIQGLSQEVQSQINNTIGDLGIPDMVRAGKEIEDAIAGTKTGVLQIDARIQGKNGRQTWNRQFTVEQSASLLGKEGQQKMKQEGEISQVAADIATNNADAAQGDFVTQEIMKKIAMQNAQTTKVLQLVQGSLQEQNKLTAATNVNLGDISENLAVERKRKQNESQGVINAIYRDAAFADGFWSNSNK